LIALEEKNMKKLLYSVTLILAVFMLPAFAANMFEAMKSSAESGDAAAQYKLAMEYYAGEYFTKDLKKCAEWCEKSAAQGYAKAQMQLGVLYTYGEGVPKDLKKGFEWEEKAALQGYAVAQFGVGGKYIRGEGVPVDSKKALEWLGKAAEQGNIGALNTLAIVYQQGNIAGIPKDLVRAYAYFDVFAKSGGNKEVASASMNGLLKAMTGTQPDEARKMSRDMFDKIENNKKNPNKNSPAPSGLRISVPPPPKNPALVPPPPIIAGQKNEAPAKINAGAYAPTAEAKALKLALMNKNVENLRQLLEKGADLKALDSNGENSLFHLTCGGTGGDNDEKSAVMAAMLVEKGVGVNAKNKFGQTVFMMAAKYGNVPLMKFLVEKGADVNARSDNGSTALGYARKAKREESVNYLVSINAAE